MGPPECHHILAGVTVRRIRLVARIRTFVTGLSVFRGVFDHAGDYNIRLHPLHWFARSGSDYNESVSKQDLSFTTPILNAAGTLGFAPAADGPLPLETLGAFFTNPISLAPRSPARPPRTLQFPGGFLLHTGYPNPGLPAAVKRYARQWARAPVPVIVHLLAQDPDPLPEAVSWLEETEGVAGLEVGLPPGCDSQTATSMADSSVGELPVIIRLPFENAAPLARSLANSAIAGLSLSPPRGALRAADGKIIRGRLYGPGVFPQALHLVEELVQEGTPIIAAGGVYQGAQIKSLLEAGAQAVQLDAVLWRGGLKPDFLEDIV